jgi:flagellar biosynthetic protein FlhB
MADSSGDKKHSASDQRRRKAREDGQVVRSQDLASALMLICAMIVLRWQGPPLAEGLANLILDGISRANPAATTTSDAAADLNSSLTTTAQFAVPIMIAMLVAAILSNVLQTGPMLTTSRIMPKFSHVNPFSGVKRLFSLPSVMRLTFGLFKVLVVSTVAFYVLRNWQAAVLGAAQMPMPQLAGLIFQCCTETGIWIGGALLVLALLEYAFQWWKFEEDLKMTDQEMRDEIKESQGDPQVIQRRRQVQRQLAMGRLSGEVPKSDVVVTNPTELAIAIQYDPEKMIAPIVVAKGAGVIAQRIRRLALENEIPIVERKPLAQILYKTVDVGGAIPIEQYKAVAEVLKYVYQLKGRKPPTLKSA